MIKCSKCKWTLKKSFSKGSFWVGWVAYNMDEWSDRLHDKKHWCAKHHPVVCPGVYGLGDEW